MIRNMFVWKKSIYDNNFKCNQCGAKLFNSKTGKPTDNLAVDANAEGEEKSLCFCARCQNVVAKWEELEVDESDDQNILRGSYSEWIEKKALDMKAEIQKKVEERLEKKYEQKIKSLENAITSRDATIRKLKVAQEVQLKEKDIKIQELSKSLRHTETQIERLREEVNGSVGKED